MAPEVTDKEADDWFESFVSKTEGASSIDFTQDAKTITKVGLVFPGLLKVLGIDAASDMTKDVVITTHIGQLSHVELKGYDFAKGLEKWHQNQTEQASTFRWANGSKMCYGEVVADNYKATIKINTTIDQSLNSKLETAATQGTLSTGVAEKASETGQIVPSASISVSKISQGEFTIEFKQPVALAYLRIPIKTEAVTDSNGVQHEQIPGKNFPSTQPTPQ